MMSFKVKYICTRCTDSDDVTDDVIDDITDDVIDDVTDDVIDDVTDDVIGTYVLVLVHMYWWRHCSYLNYDVIR